LIPHPTRLSSTLGLTAVGGIVYLAVLMAIDSETRSLVTSIFRKVKSRFGKH